ncbi:MAG: hypothetical protein HYZ72_18940, partial [Deltaproteobacteria bacterium]|nr:hypothetical protein [Deltaproteobacteria bacterium]
KRLLYEEGFTIAGAKKRLKESEKDELLPASPLNSQQTDYRQVLYAIREDLRALYMMLNEKPR